MSDSTYLVLFFGIVLIFGGIGAAIARTRGYSALLGFAVGWTGFLAWLILALLPRRTEQAEATQLYADGAEGAFPRVDRLLRVLYPLSLGLYFGLMGTIALLGWLIPSVRFWVENHPVAEVALGAVGAITALMIATIFVLSLYLLIKDKRLPASSRGPWTFALIFFNMLAALVFVPWRWRTLRRQRLSESRL